MGLYHYLYIAPKPFNRDIWLAGEQAEFNSKAPRLRIADGLVEDKILIGKEIKKVIQMLGPPTNTEYFSDYDLVYWLGLERGLIGIDSEWLVIRFNKNGYVNEVKIITD